MLQEKGRSANKIDQRALELVIPRGPSTPTGQDSDANKTPSPTGPATRLPDAPKHHSVWAHGEKLALMHRMVAEGLSNKQAAVLIGTTPVVITAWRRELGFAGRRGDGPRRYTEAQKRETLARIDAGEITVSDAAAEFGTTPNAIYGWRQGLKKLDASAPASPALREMKLRRPDGSVIELMVTQTEAMAILSE